MSYSTFDNLLSAVGSTYTRSRSRSRGRSRVRSLPRSSGSRAIGLVREAASAVESMSRSRSRSRVGSNTERPKAHAGGAGGVQSKTSSQTVFLSKKPNTQMQRMLHMLSLKESSLIARFQKLTPFSYGNTAYSMWPFGYTLNKQYINAVNTQVAMPLYAFNLTSSPIHPAYMRSGAYLNARTVPLYRLHKNITGSGPSDATTGNYFWIKQAGLTDAADGSDSLISDDRWNVEKITSARTGSDAVTCFTNGHYQHDWTSLDITLGFRGNGQRKMHCALAQFPNEQAGPLREYALNTSSTVSDDIAVNTDDRSKSDLWWDHFWAKHTIHPLRSVRQMYPGKSVVLKNYECICLESMSNLADGAAQFPVYQFKQYMKDGRLYRCADADKAESAHRPDINTALNPHYNVELTSYQQNPFPDRKKDVWAFIWADDFDGIFANGSLPENARCGFDLVAKGKFTYSQI